MKENVSPQTAGAEGQYGLVKILGIWAAAAVPMGILGWVVAPALAPDSTEDPIGAAITRVGVLTVGLVWQFILSMIIVRREGGDLRWSTIRHLSGRRAPLPGRALAKDGGRVWQVGLGGQRGADGDLSPASALGHTDSRDRQCFPILSSKQAISMHLDGNHCPFRAERVLCFPDPWHCVGVGVGCEPLAFIIALVSVLVDCGPSKADLRVVNYTTLARDDWPVSKPPEQALDPMLVAELYGLVADFSASLPSE
jgi:hypothetical protein